MSGRKGKEQGDHTGGRGLAEPRAEPRSTGRDKTIHYSAVKLGREG